jgi:hypothetical protein
MGSELAAQHCRRGGATIAGMTVRPTARGAPVSRIVCPQALEGGRSIPPNYASKVPVAGVCRQSQFGHWG